MKGWQFFAIMLAFGLSLAAILVGHNVPTGPHWACHWESTEKYVCRRTDSEVMWK